MLWLGLAVAAGSAPSVVAAVPATPTDEQAAVDRAHREIWRRFISPHGHLFDYTGLAGEVILPTREECLANQPNALGWSTPIEDGAFLGGLYLDALCRRWRVTGDATTAERAKRIAGGLLLLAAVGDTPGFIARGVASDGRSHYPASSSDQTYPWIYGMWRYATSGLPGQAEREQVVAVLTRVVTGLERNNWEMPIDRKGFGHFGHWTVGFAGTKGVLVGAEPNFDAATRLLFVLRAMHHLTGDARWLEAYRSRLYEKPAGSDRTRLEICAYGVDYVAPGEAARFPESPRLWTSASSQAGLRVLWELETEVGVREKFQRGLTANARRAMKFINGYRRYDNANQLVFNIRWHVLNELWKPQSDISEAVTLGRLQKGDGSAWATQSPRLAAESVHMRDPLFAAWVVSLSGNQEIIAESRNEIRGVLTHFDWERLYMGLFFMAECVHWQLRSDGR